MRFRTISLQFTMCLTLLWYLSQCLSKRCGRGIHTVEAGCGIRRSRPVCKLMLGAPAVLVRTCATSLFVLATSGRIVIVSSKTFRTTIVREGSMCFIPVTFDPVPVFGRVRAPVKVTLNGYTYRSTIASMGGTVCIPLRKSNREAAGLDGNETLEVTLALDQEKREVKPPSDFVKALKAAAPAWERWKELSYSHQREYVEAIEAAKRPDTRARRIAAAVRQIGERAAKTRVSAP